MAVTYLITARYDQHEKVWIAVSHKVVGLVLETDSWDELLQEIRNVVPDLLVKNGQDDKEVTIRLKSASPPREQEFQLAL